MKPYLHFLAAGIGYAAGLFILFNPSKNIMLDAFLITLNLGLATLNFGLGFDEK